MAIQKYLWFNLDGTHYHLYNVPNWLEYLEDNNMSVYNQKGYTIRSIKRIRAVIRALQAAGWCVGVISWGSKSAGAQARMLKDTLKYKTAWARENCPELLEDNLFIVTPYSENKFTVAMQVDHSGVHVLVDDNKMIRQDWKKRGGIAINASHSFIKQIEGLLG